MKLLINNNLNELDEKYPDRHKIIHKGCCKYCPSNINNLNAIIDPESAEIKTYRKETIAKEYLFVCAWRPDKLCKGNCDEMGIDQNYLNNLYEKISSK